MDVIKENVMRQLTINPKEDFANYFVKQKGCWDTCVKHQWGYPEGDQRTIILDRLFLLTWLDIFGTNLVYQLFLTFLFVSAIPNDTISSSTSG